MNDDQNIVSNEIQQEATATIQEYLDENTAHQNSMLVHGIILMIALTLGTAFETRWFLLVWPAYVLIAWIEFRRSSSVRKKIVDAYVKRALDKVKGIKTE